MTIMLQRLSIKSKEPHPNKINAPLHKDLNYPEIRASLAKDCKLKKLIISKLFWVINNLPTGWNYSYPLVTVNLQLHSNQFSRTCIFCMKWWGCTWLTLFRPGFFELFLTSGGGFGCPPPLCSLKTVNAMVTKLIQDDADNNSSNFRCLVDMLTKYDVIYPILLA